MARARPGSSWRPRSRCQLRRERGESDYFLGGMMFNVALAEGVFVILLVATLAATWPRVPWTLLQYGAPAAMVLAPIVLYPSPSWSGSRSTSC